MFMLTKRWRTNRWAFWGLCIAEFCIIIAALTLFGVASPNLYRTQLQLFGAIKGWNSDPDLQLYAAANGVPFKEALPWSSFVTSFNVVISVLSVFILLSKVTFFILKVFIPLLSVLAHITLVVLYTYSAYAQAGPDRADPNNIQHGPPWFISRGCGMVTATKLKGFCRQAQASFGVTIILVVLYAAFLGLSIYNMWPSDAEREKHETRRAEKAELKLNHKSVLTDEMQWQLHNIPTPGLPPLTARGTVMTPRTNAFNLLNGIRPPMPALPTTAAMAAARQRPTTTVIIPQAVPIHSPAQVTSSPLSTTPGSGSMYKSDLPFRNIA